MFLLIDFENQETIGAFDTVDGATNYAQIAFGCELSQWSQPDSAGFMWADADRGELHISPVEVNPTADASR